MIRRCNTLSAAAQTTSSESKERRGAIHRCTFSHTQQAPREHTTYTHNNKATPQHNQSHVCSPAAAAGSGSSRFGKCSRSGNAAVKPRGEEAVTPSSSLVVGGGGGRGEAKSPPRFRCGVKRLLVAPGSSRDARMGEVKPAPPLPPPLSVAGLAACSPPAHNDPPAGVMLLSSPSPFLEASAAPAASLEPAASPVSLLKRLLTLRLLRGLLEIAGGCFCRANENGAGSGDDTSIIAGEPNSGPGVERSAAPFMLSRPALEGVAALVACESMAARVFVKSFFGAKIRSAKFKLLAPTRILEFLYGGAFELVFKHFPALFSAQLT